MQLFGISQQHRVCSTEQPCILRGSKHDPHGHHPSQTITIVYASFSLATRYRLDHFTNVSFGAGGVTTSSKYRLLEFSSTNINSTFFLNTFVTFTNWSPPSYNDIKKLRSVPNSVLCAGDGLPASPSATGFAPFPGNKTQHSDPPRSGPCLHWFIQVSVVVRLHAILAFEIILE